MSKYLIKLISLILSLSLILEQSVFAQAIDFSRYLNNPVKPALQSDKFRPLHLRYLGYDNLNQDFKLFLDKGDTKKEDLDSKAYLEENTQTLLKYFFIGLALPNDKFWVNLRPDSPDNILDPDLEKTDIGRIFLEADVQLKKDTAGMTSPQTPEGKAYWDKLYKKAGELFGSENITIPTLTRPWIVPGEIIIRETIDSAYIYKATLKVMLEEDYLSRGRSRTAPTMRTAPTPDQYTFSDPRLKELNQYSTQIIKEAIIPKLTYAVNTSKRYAPLRQVYYSLILAQWFKQKYGGVRSTRAPGTSAPVNSYIDLIDSINLSNLTSSQPYDKQSYFQQYQKSFKDGEYSLQEPVYTPMGQSIRRYMSGGMKMNCSSAITEGKVYSSVVLAPNSNYILTAGTINGTGNISISASPISDIKQEIVELLLKPIKSRNGNLSRYKSQWSEINKRTLNDVLRKYRKYWMPGKVSVIKPSEQTIEKLSIIKPQAVEVVRSFIFNNPLKEEEYYEYAKKRGLLKENTDYRLIFEEIAENAMMVMGFDAWEMGEMINNALVIAVPDAVVDQEMDKSNSRLFNIIRILYDRRNGITNTIDNLFDRIDMLIHGDSVNNDEMLRQEAMKLLPEDISKLADYIVKKYLESQETSFSPSNFYDADHKNILFIKVNSDAATQEIRRHIAAETGHAILQYFTDSGRRICLGLHETFDVMVQMFIGEKNNVSDDEKKIVEILEGLSEDEIYTLTQKKEDANEYFDLLKSPKGKYYEVEYSRASPDNVVRRLQSFVGRRLLEKGFTKEELNELFEKDRVFVSHSVGAVNADRLVKEIGGSVVHALGIAGEVLRSAGEKDTGSMDADVFSDYRKFYERFSEIVSNIEIVSDVKRRTALAIPGSRPWSLENMYEPFKEKAYFNSKFLFPSASSAGEKADIEGLTSSPATSSDKGGIAFNALPIQTESVASSALGVLPGARAFKGDLDAEWERIRDVFNAGIRPSIQRLSEYTAAAVASPLAEDKIDQVRVMLADILRRDEESQKLTPAEESCKQLLRTLESG